MEWLSLTNVLLLLIFFALCIVCFYLLWIFEAVEKNVQSTMVGNKKLEVANQSLSEIIGNTRLIQMHSKQIHINTGLILKTSKN